MTPYLLASYRHWRSCLQREQERLIHNLSPAVRTAYRQKRQAKGHSIWAELQMAFKTTEVDVIAELHCAILHLNNVIEAVERQQQPPSPPNLTLKHIRDTVAKEELDGPRPGEKA